MRRITILPLTLAVAAAFTAVAADTGTYPATGGTAAAMSSNSSSRENKESNATGSNTSAGSMNGATLSETPRTTGAMAGSPSGKLAAADKAFFMKAAQSGMLEVEASKLAQDRASSPDVKQFADMMVKDHGAADAELKQLAMARGVDLPQKLDAAHQAKLDKLSKAKGPEFDRLYSQTVGTPAHKDAVALFDKTSKSARDPEVKAFAAKTLPTLKEHLSHAQALQQTVASAAPAQTPR